MNALEIWASLSLDADEYKRGLNDAEKDANGFGGRLGRALSGTAKVVGAATVAAGTAVVGIAKSAISEYAEYEQLVGGVETLYGKSSGTLMKYAENAYKTANMSANDYMETATSFAASLVQSLGGDTEQAAEFANLAITDMSDNANKMGTDMTAIQNAYNGFAKQNYTMLDNLKLGYGGTKEEMQRLIEDANELKEAQGELGDLSIESYSDIVEAIHLVQTEMGITGTTAKEASTTVQGSINTMKGAWSNFLVALADGNSDISGSIDILIESFSTVVDNIMPLADNIIAKLPEVFSKIGSVLPELIGQMLPAILDSAVSLIVSLASNIDDLISPLVSSLPEIISALLDGLITCLPQILTGIGGLIGDIVAELPSMLGTIVTAIPDVLLGLVEGIGGGIRSIVEAVTGDDSWSQTLSGIEERVGNIATKNDELSRSIDRTREAYDGAINSSEADAYAAQVLADKLFNLIEASDGTAESNREIQTVVDMLNESVPNLGLAWDATTGYINLSKDAIYEHIEALKLEAQEEAAKSFYIDSLKEQYAAEQQLAIIQREAVELAASRGMSEAQLNEIFADGKVTLGEQHSVEDTLNISRSDAVALLKELQGLYDQEVAATENVTEAKKNAAISEDILGNAVDELTSALVEQATTAGEAGEILETNYKDAVEEVIPTTEEVAEEATDVFAEIVEANAGKAYDATSQMAQEANDGLSGLPDDMNATGNNSTTQLKTGLLANFLITKFALKSIADLFTTEFSDVPTTMTTNGQSSITALAQALASGARGNVIPTAQSIAMSITDAFASLPSNMANVGNMAGQGLYNGLSAWEGTLYNMAWSIANSINSAARAALRIHSPSQAMFEVGEFTNEGLVEGLEATSGDVYDTAYDIADGITGAFDGADYTADVTANGNGNDLYGLLSTYLPQIANMQIYLDGKQLVGNTITEINNGLNQLNTKSRRGGVYA